MHLYCMDKWWGILWGRGVGNNHTLVPVPQVLVTEGHDAEARLVVKLCLVGT